MSVVLASRDEQVRMRDSTWFRYDGRDDLRRSDIGEQSFLENEVRIDGGALPPVFSGPRTNTAKCRCGVPGGALPLVPT